MGLCVKTWIAVFLLAVVAAPGAQRNAVSVLSRRVSHFSIGQTTVLDALLWLGHDERVCFGIEFQGPELGRNVRVATDRTTLSEVVKEILGSSNAYQLSISDGVILVRKKGLKPPSWLDHRLPQFVLPRTELMSANNVLWMTLERDLNPSMGGVAGDFPPTDPIDEVGPFREHGQTVRQLLIRIVSSSRGASWFPTTNGVGVPFPGSVDRFWTLVTYSGSHAIRPK
jgi:hypothetical protein